MKLSAILIFWGISILSFLNCKNSTIGMIREIGINDRYYPKWYIQPSKKIKKLFKLEQSCVPKYLNFELVIAIIFIILGPINSIVYILTNGSKTFLGLAFLFHICLVILNSLFFVVVSLFYKKH